MVKVFVSYSHDPLPVDAAADRRERDRNYTLHRAHALDLAEYLRHNGIDCKIDQYHEDDPPDSWPQWMETQIVECDYVLMVCTPSYYRHVTEQGANSPENGGGGEKGHGSRFEGRVIYGFLTKKPTARKFIPIFFGPRQPKYIPHVIAQSTSYQILFPLDMEMPEQRDLWRLYGKLTGQATTALTPIGKKRKLEDKENVHSELEPVAHQPKKSIDWCLKLTNKDLDVGDKMRLQNIEPLTASGGALFCFEYSESIEMTCSARKAFFMLRLMETMKVKEIEGVIRLKSVKAKGVIEVTSSDLMDPVNVLCFLGYAENESKTLKYDRSNASKTQAIASEKSAFEFSFEQTLEPGESYVKLIFRKENNGTEKPFQFDSWKCSVKNLKTSISAEIEKK